jgi:hypothetical protein
MFKQTTVAIIFTQLEHERKERTKKCGRIVMRPYGFCRTLFIPSSVSRSAATFPQGGRLFIFPSCKLEKNCYIILYIIKITIEVFYENTKRIYLFPEKSPHSAGAAAPLLPKRARE